MRMKRLIIPALLLLMLVGCKPTEKNYREAYDKAYEAAQRRTATEMESVSGQRIERMDGPRVEIVNGDTLYVGKEIVKAFEADTLTPSGKTAVAVARFTQPTNARRLVKDLLPKYKEAFIATDGRDSYYVVIKRVADLNEAADAIHVFKSLEPNYPFIGLGGQPLIVYLRE